jgi:hypothetical protein
MTEVRNFVAAHVTARKGMGEVKISNEQAYCNISLKRAQIYQIIYQVKEEKSTDIQWYSNSKKSKAMRTSSPLSPQLVKRNTAKLSNGFLQPMAKARTLTGGFYLRL